MIELYPINTSSNWTLYHWKYITVSNAKANWYIFYSEIDAGYSFEFDIKEDLYYAIYLGEIKVSGTRVCIFNK